MKTIIRDMPANYKIWNWGDTHEGNIAICDKTTTKFSRRVKSTKNGYATFGGDQCEAIMVNDPRFSLDLHLGRSARIYMQRDNFITRFKCLQDRVLWLMNGNHEDKLSNVTQPNKDIAKALCSNGVEGYANTRLVKAIFPQFRMIDWHGWGNINSMAGDPRQRAVNNGISLKRKMRNLPGGDCEILVSHHFHKLMMNPPNSQLEIISNPKDGELIQIYTQPEKIWIDKSKGLYRIPEEDKYYVCSGSALRAYVEDVPSYVENAGYSATELGCIMIEVKNDKLYKVEEVIL